MLNIIRALPTTTILAALPALAATPGLTQTGITRVGPSVVIFSIAAAVLLTLLVRASAQRLTRQVGERAGNRRLRRQLTAHSPHVRSDCLLPGAYGGIAKIDHLMLSRHGFVCIRAIHASGAVTGAGDDPQWLIVEGGRKRRFLNPMIQNEGRSRALRKALPDVPVTNLVVFTGRVAFAGEQPANAIRSDRLDSWLTAHVSGPARISDPDAAWQSLNAAVLEDSASRKDFSAQISFG